MSCFKLSSQSLVDQYFNINDHLYQYKTAQQTHPKELDEFLLFEKFKLFTAQLKQNEVDFGNSNGSSIDGNISLAHFQNFQAESRPDFDFFENVEKVENDRKIVDKSISKSVDVYITIEEGYCGCDKVVSVITNDNTEEVFIVKIRRGIRDGEVITTPQMTFVVHYLKHQFLSRRGDDLVVNKEVFMSVGVRHPLSSLVFVSKDKNELLKLKGFTDNGKTVLSEVT
ncbi:hypothetical protein EIN_239410 [Entamoeba invadens IP1]|uniref:Uncharacterized protein n=1 Tax=Entamoeba invadens IP1 TaxID=370355 RepID=A0A0A1UGS0_ENTIV|nr:hypothetical protein EIN_239410 [Entamoeba invadens IP1]ELP93631.1 hypothetical protein EIN_239410 [Entamoeba invadens IP1]|eukprot:XP_004260402.1 hypothetical protein EIN_239410 [Entamoeba invadens IP1]